jgi:hypothetical protein
MAINQSMLLFILAHPYKTNTATTTAGEQPLLTAHLPPATI